MEKKSETTRKTKAKTKKTSLKSIKQAHGKQENVKFEPRTLDQVWGDTGISKFGTLDVEEYAANLNDMNKSDLQTHATKVGLVPVDDVSLLRKRLTKELKILSSLAQM